MMIQNYLNIRKKTDAVMFILQEFRLPKTLQNCSPNHNKNKDVDNVSTTTSMRNFLTDVTHDILDNEARIINEVIQEEADISDSSIDSHWLQDDASMLSDFRFDFGLSPFSTHSIVNDHCYTLPYDFNHENLKKKSENHKLYTQNNQENNLQINESDATRCVIDKNLDKALLDESTDRIALEDLLATPPIVPNAWAPSTPTINNILFGDKLDDEFKKSGQNIEKYKEVQGTIDVLEEFLNLNTFEDKVYDSVKENGLIETILKDTKFKTKESCNTNQDFDNTNETESIATSIITDDMKQNGKHVIIEESDNKIRLKIIKRNTDSDIVMKIDKNDEKLNQLNPVKINNNNEKDIRSPNEDECCLKELLCKLCDKKFDKLRFLKIHFTKKHKMRINPSVKSQVKRICAYCGLETKQSLSRFLKHIDTHVNKVSYSCKKCRFTFSTKRRLLTHENIHKGVSDAKPAVKQKKIMCDICGRGYTSSNYHVHMRRHLKDYKYNCVECDAGFYRRTDLTLHMRTHTGERPMACTFCSKSFKRRDILNVHIRRHTGERPFKCDICNKTFTTKHNLMTHQSRSKKCLMLQEKLAFPNGVQDLDVSME
ncbi:zinc finger protein 436 isoform X2 [Pieris rapae]|uniref:zinc finger protein 436 isoform X2 n=1 Tax=Pieris rapae TaxID=64459 RepID=UPI001E281290|nr:zinc finger protein 436 isoform X2 [Pieris rapae]